MKHMRKTYLIFFITILVMIFNTTSFATNEILNNVQNENIKNTASAVNTANETIQTEIQDQTFPTDLNLYSKSCILIETKTQNIAYEKNIYEKLYPASTTKLLTAIIAMEKCQLTDIVTITNEMVSNIPSGYTTAYLKPGEKVTVEQLLNVLLIPSANDAGYALAIHISGSIDEFSELMNLKAKELGCENSNFTNPSGIHDPNHYSTVSDMSKIGLQAIKNNMITEICSKTSYTLNPTNGVSRTFETTNTLMKKDTNNYYEYVNGLKTGFTEPAGSCIVATASKDNKNFLVVAFGAPAPENGISYRDIDCKTLFEYGFANYEKIIQLNKNFIETFINIIYTNNLVNIAFKFTIIFGTFFLFSVFLKKKKNKRNKKMDLNVNDKEFHFRCFNW